MGACRQSVICRVLLSNGSEHLGSESERHSQHLIANPEIRMEIVEVLDVRWVFVVKEVKGNVIRDTE